MTAARGIPRSFTPTAEDFALCSGDRYCNSYNSRGGVLVRQALVLESCYDQRAAKKEEAKTTSATPKSLVLPEA